MDFQHDLKSEAPTSLVPILNRKTGDIYFKNTDLTNLLFKMPYDLASEVVKPLLCDVSQYLLNNGISPENINVALLCYLGINSGRLGYPFAIILKSEEPTVARHLLEVCKSIAPRDAYTEIQEISYEYLYQNQEKFKNKVIICENPKGCKNAMPDLQDLIANGSASRQITNRNKLGDRFETLRIQYPVGFIGVEYGNGKMDFNHLSIFRINIPSVKSGQHGPILGQVSYGLNEDGFDSASMKIIKIFERLNPGRVDIPYLDQIYKDILKQQPACFAIKFILIQKIISILALSNNPKLLTPEEFYAGYLGMKTPMKTDQSNDQTIIASKVEFFQAAQILKGVLSVNDMQLTMDQTKVFQTVKGINSVRSMDTMFDQDDEIKVLSSISSNQHFWALKPDIFAKVNQQYPDKFLSMPIIVNILNSLIALGIISKTKLPKSTEYGYFVNQTSIMEHIEFQNPSLINDTRFGSAPVKVVNQLNMEIETI